MTPIRMVDLAARHAEVAAEAEAAVLAVLRSGRWIGGPVVTEVEQRLAARFNAAFAVGVNSGTDALALSLQAAGVTAGTEVIVPALSFQASAGAVRMIGAVPVVVDVNEQGLIDPAAVQAALSPLTSAVVPVHLFGNCVDPLQVGVAVVDDAAQAVGSKPAPLTGVAAAVSTYPSKIWGAAGDGGFVVTDDSELAARARALGSHGYTPAGGFVDPGGSVARNSRLDAVQAAVLLAHEGRLDARIAHRQRLAAHYRQALPSAVHLLPVQPGANVAQLVVRVADRSRVVARLSEAGIETRVYYPYTLSHTPGTVTRAPTPVADALCASLLALPCHSGLHTEHVDRVCDALRTA